jgi:primosomal protein N' (replication factor Y)
MFYYEVLIGDMQYHGSEALTYSSENSLVDGSIVRIHLRNRPVLGIILRQVAKPSFAAKPIAAVAISLPIPVTSLKLIEWLQSYYPAPFGAIVRLFLPPSTSFPKPAADVKSINSEKEHASKTPVIDTRKLVIELPPLNDEQSKAVETIAEPGSYLLHGITGSGKSRIYLELARKTVNAGRSVLMLTPEIGLTAQLTDSFKAVFGEQVVLLHSAMTAAKRRDAWYELLSSKQPKVVIGPRSALFSPLQNVGLIILDESHDQAYKNESAPHYNANRVAAVLAQLHKAVFVSGSATPTVEDYYIATRKGRPIIRLSKLATKHEISPTKVISVDLRDQNNFGRSRILSTKLLEIITTALAKGEQSLLFLNRRGTANVVLCNNCGWQQLCPNCDLPLTYHGDEHRLRCHICGFNMALIGECPICSNSDILLKSIGTKAVLDEVQRLFPDAKVQRFDTDLGKEDRLEKHIGALKGGSADIIVGTQIVAKGLDLPRLSVVGVISADSSLLMPDYTATEHTYQLISQVVGRVGRGHRAGTVVIQSYEPGNPTLVSAVSADWKSFYETELAEREAFHFPPFSFILKLNVLRATSKAAEQAAEKVSLAIHQAHSNVTVDGPTPAFHPRDHGKYNWQIVIKSRTRATLVAIISELPSGWSYDIDPGNLL